MKLISRKRLTLLVAKRVATMLLVQSNDGRRAFMAQITHGPLSQQFFEWLAAQPKQSVCTVGSRRVYVIFAFDNRSIDEQMRDRSSS